LIENDLEHTREHSGILQMEQGDIIKAS